jgi:hypothetical protein
MPPLDPVLRHWWDEAEAHMSWEKYEDEMKGVKEFRAWFNAQVLTTDERTCSESM